jgi:hypothetical protein
MDRNTAIERAWPADSRSIWGGTIAISPMEWKIAFSLSRGEALILVLLLSFGLWAAIWGAIALLALFCF